MARRRSGQWPTPKKEKGQWKIRYYTDQAQEDGTVRRVKKTKCLGRVEEVTFRQAKKEASRFLQPINDVEPGIEHAEKTLNELIHRWRRDVKPNLKRSTQSQYDAWAIKKWIQPLLGSWPLREITKPDVQSFMANASKTLSGKSVRGLRVVLRSVLSLAVEWEWLKSNPAAGRFRLPKARPTRAKYIVEPQQFRALLDALKQPHGTIVALAALGGLRKGEIEGLRWNDITQGKLVVDEAVYERVIGTPKTDTSHREVRVGPLVDSLLADWKLTAPFTGDQDFVFALRTPTPIDLHHVMARHVKPVCERLGLPRIGWHDLRHTYTTWGRRAGVDPEAMRDQLGHSSVQITLDVYSHIENGANAAASIERYAAGLAA